MRTGAGGDAAGDAAAIDDHHLQTLHREFIRRGDTRDAGTCDHPSQTWSPPSGPASGSTSISIHNDLLRRSPELLMSVVVLQ
jgi:hypothetical protein